jgi:hypothetical protein
VSRFDACSQARWTPAELGDRVVAVVEEDPFVEFLGPVEPDRGIDGVIAAHIEITDELVEEQRRSDL